MIHPFSEDPIDISPVEFEKQIKNIFEGLEREIKKIEIIHNDKINTVNGNFQIDIKVTFEFLGVDFIVLVECKKHNSPIKRETIQIVKDKVLILGVHKGILVSASGFQRGAIQYAKNNGVALIKIDNGKLEYETRSTESLNVIPSHINFPKFVFSVIEMTEKEAVQMKKINFKNKTEFENIFLN